MSIGQALGFLFFAAFLLLWICTGWSGVRRWFAVLWACRVSVVSAVAGYFVLFGFEQAQDLFAEVGWSGWRIFYFCIAVLLWVISVHFAARLMLSSRSWVPRDEVLEFGWDKVRELYYFPGVWVPRVLGLTALGGVLVGIHKTRANLRPIAESSINIVPSARNALDGIHQLEMAVWLTLTLFLVTVFFRRPFIEWMTGKPAPFLLVGQKLRNPREAWAESRSGTLLALIKWTLIFICVGAVAGAMVEPFRLAESVSRAVFLMLILGVWVMPLTLIAFLSHRVRAPLIAIGVFIAALVSAYVPRVHDIRTLDEAATGARQMDLAEAVRRWRAANECEEPKLIEKCPRPIILAAAGGASRASFFTSTVIGTLLDQTHGGGELREFSQQLFALSTVSGSSVGAVMARTALADAANSNDDHLWRRGPCKLRITDESGRATWRRGDGFGHFASQPIESWRHCLQVLSTGDYLSPVAIGLGLRDLLFLPPLIGQGPWWEDRAYLLEHAWERHYDIVVKGSVSDLPEKARLGQPFGIERRMSLKQGSGPSEPPLQTKESRPDRPQTKWLPLLILNGTSVMTGRRILASDLAPSYQWDQQSKCRPSDSPEPCPIFQESFDVFEMLGSPATTEMNESKGEGLVSWLASFVPSASGSQSCNNENWRSVTERAPDIRLSTAATMSARFPLVSPSGAIRDCSGNVIDRVIDGGYFENGGLFTAADLAQALKAFKLESVILYIANDPVPLADDSNRRPRGKLGPALPKDSGSEFLSDILTPALGLYSTRAGHSAEAARIADASVSPHFYSFLVFDPLMDRQCAAATTDKKSSKDPCAWSMAKVSMSWWLSQPVQEYLDKQLEKHPRNEVSMNRFIGLLRRTCDHSPTKDCQPLEIIRSRQAAQLD